MASHRRNRGVVMAVTRGFVMLLAFGGSLPDVGASSLEKLNGYAEAWRRGVLIVDGQRVRQAPGAKFKGHGVAQSFRDIPLGYEVKVKGSRLPNGTFLADEVEAKPNGEALFEGDLRDAFDVLEARYRRTRRMFEEEADGHVVTYGPLREEGPEVERVRWVLESLIPSYLDPSEFRAYVVDNREWNAIAAPNGSFYVFTGLLDNLDDDELALILGHELAHVTHEHSRKEFKKGFLVQLGAAGLAAAAEEIENDGQRIAAQAAVLLAAAAWQNGYGRNQEDQADRVGMWYAYDAGYDVTKGPALWERFAGEYGNGSRALNFFFADHAASRDRAAKLRTEIARNYSPEARRGGESPESRPSRE